MKQKAKPKWTYKVYIEGGLYETTTSKKRADRIRSEAESEGWNVKVIQWTETIIGPIGVDA